MLSRFVQKLSFKSRRLLQNVALATLVVFTPLAIAGCYGTFPLTRGLHYINGEVTDSGIVHTLILYVLLFFGAYGVTTLIDFFILNLIEFWSGEEIWITMGDSEHDVRMAVKPTEDANRKALLLVHKDTVLAEQSLIRVSDSLIEIRDSEGRLVGTMEKGVESVAVKNADGKVLREYPADHPTFASL